MRLLWTLISDSPVGTFCHPGDGFTDRLYDVGHHRSGQRVWHRVGQRREEESVLCTCSNGVSINHNTSTMGFVLNTRLVCFRSGEPEVVSESDCFHPERRRVVASHRGSYHQQSECKRLRSLVGTGSHPMCLLLKLHKLTMFSITFIRELFLSRPQPSQSAVHGATRDVLQVGQLASGE